MSDPADIFLSELEEIVRQCQRKQSENAFFNENEFESISRRFEHFIRTLEFVENPSESLQALIEEVRLWHNWLHSQPISCSTCCSTTGNFEVYQLRSGQCGRPKLDISRDILEFLRDMRFSWVQVSNMFGVSRSTIIRRVRQFGVQQSTQQNNISDADLRTQVQEIHASYAHAGCRMVRGILVSRGFRVSVNRVHETLTEIDPLLSAQRWGAMVRRRQYSVKAANSLWHIDGHHSLIRWGFVIHGGIDGFS